MRIAIIEDNESVARGIAYRLADRGHASDIVQDGLQADEFLRGDGNEIIILDIDLPGLDGVSVLRNLRRRGDMRPVLLLTAKADTRDRVEGLDAGADDYLVKPFEMDELEARIRALSRRKGTEVRNEFRIGTLVFDLTDRSVTGKGDALDIPRRELAVLEILMRDAGKVVAKEKVLEHLYGMGSDVDASAVEVHVSRLRKRLRGFGVEISTLRGLGYRLTRTGEA